MTAVPSPAVRSKTDESLSRAASKSASLKSRFLADAVSSSTCRELAHLAGRLGRAHSVEDGEGRAEDAEASPIVAATLAAKSGDRRIRAGVTDIGDLQFQTHFSSAYVTVS